MKKIFPRTRLAFCLPMMLLLLAGMPAHAAGPALHSQLTLRPLTAVEVTTYGLPTGTELSGGLTTAGIGAAIYLEADVNLAIPPADITNVTWALTTKPVGSTATLANSPLGGNVPIYEPASRLVSQVVGRKLLRLDVPGQYTVSVTIQTGSSGSTNLTQNLTGATYMGINTCALCHSGGVIASDKYSSWSQSLHHQIFADQIDGHAGPLRESCNQCHTTGYNLNPAATNGGFDDMAKQYGWTIPPVLKDGNWASMQTNYPAVANLANVQCESCHGPGSQHATSLGKTNFISISLDSGSCNQCHDAADHHPYGTEWLNSGHAVSTRVPAEEAEENPVIYGACLGCHTSIGFIQRLKGVNSNRDTSYLPINCQTCHEPHGETTPANNPHMIRTLASVTFQEGTTVTNAGEGLLCMQCHQARVNAKTYASNPNNASSRFGPHHGPQGDMLEGINGYTYGKNIPSSAHATAVTNTCITCHMQKLPSSDPAFTHAGGHTFNVSSTNGDLVAACQQCHGSSVTSFDIALKDYNGDGVIEGVQTEVKHLMDKLSTLLPNASGVVDGLVKVPVPAKTWTPAQMEATYNYLFIAEDKSMGIHNTAYTVGLLKASIADLTGDANDDGLPDAWQIQYFGSATSPNAAPNAAPAGDGVPNWLKYALGLDPRVPGVVVPNGVVWANATALGGSTDEIQIFTAAEVVFNTETGKSYQIQSVSSLSAGWQNVGEPISGTGQSISYVTPTRSNAQQFYRVVHTP